MNSNGIVSIKNLDEFFPAPSLPPSPLSPQRLPGANLESLAALREVLKDNYQYYHTFVNHKDYHNHVSHRALAIYALGGSADIIKGYYKRDIHIQRPAVQPPGHITEDNFLDHTEDENYYHAYIAFFCKQISEKGIANILEEFVFSEKYNFQKGRDMNTQPEMLNHFVSGVLHPIIQVGYGVEFGLNGVVAEGLATAAVQRLPGRAFLPPSIFASDATNGIEHITSLLPGVALDAPVTSKTGNVHAFDIVASILQDNRLHYQPAPMELPSDRFTEVFVESAPMIWDHAKRWTIDLNKPGEVERKMEELVWLSSLVYAVGGFQPSGFQPDFFLMHAVTSSLALPSFLPYLTPQSQVLFFRAYLVTVLSWWVVRGRPAINIKSFMTTTSVEPSVSSPPASQTTLDIEMTPTPNPFLPILQSAITHPNDHMCKIQRTFAHFDTLYGTRPAGCIAGTELEGAGLLDGSFFLRSALLTADYIGWVREGKEAQIFTRKTF